MPGKETQEIGLTALEKSRNHEREKSGEQQKDHHENVCDWRSEVAGHFTFCDRQNMPPRTRRRAPAQN